MTINDVGGNSRSIPLPTGPSNTEIEVRVIAPNGNDRTYLITVNQPAPAEPPAPTSAPDLISEDDSCPLDTVTNECLPPLPPNTIPFDEDNITKVNTPRFRIPQPPSGVTPKLYINGVKDVDSTFDQGLLRPSTPFSDGTYTITYTLTNAGGESSQSPSLSVEIDTIILP